MTSRYNTQKFTLDLPLPLAIRLENSCKKAWREMCDLHKHKEFQSASRIIHYDEWIASTEGKWHNYIFQAHFMQMAQMTPKQLDRMIGQLQAKSFSYRGTRRRFAPEYHNVPAYMAFRRWFVSKLLAEYYNEPFDEACPVSPTVSKEYVPATFTEMTERFEEFTGCRPPDSVWEAAKKADREAESQAA